MDLISQSRNSTFVNLHLDSLNDLNHFFAQLCSDDSYVPPSDVVITPDVEIPQIIASRTNDVTKIETPCVTQTNKLFNVPFLVRR